MKPAPELIGNARVLRWSVIDQRHHPTGKCRHIVGGHLEGPVAGLAICQYEKNAGYFLLYCDTSWGEITDTWHATLDDALHQAEFEYAGVSETWREV